MYMNKKNFIFAVVFSSLVFSGVAFAATSVPVGSNVSSGEEMTVEKCEDIGLTKTIKKNSRGIQVEILQDVLINGGYLDMEEPNSIFDTATTAAVKAFQEEAGLKVDGIVGPKTRAAMAEMCIDFVAGS